MKFDTVLLDSPSRQARDSGFWLNKTMVDFLDDAVESCPDRMAIVEYRADRSTPVRMTYRQLAETVSKLASALRDLGVERGDVVSLQLPNWWQFTALTLACTRIGAVTNALMHIFRERELTHMLRFCESKVLVIPRLYRGFDYASMVGSIRSSLPHLRHVVVIDGEGKDGFDALLARQPSESEEAPSPLAPGDVQLLMYTSGTTGEPKGVTHTSNTLIACMEGLRERLKLRDGEVFLAASPVGHLTGYLVLAMMPIMLKGTTVLQDVWEPRRGLELMTAEGVTFTAASTPFLADLCSSVSAGAPSPSKLRLFLCAGAPIPSALIERALDQLKLTVASCFGTTESGACTVTDPERATVMSARSDGRALRGVETTIVDLDGTPVRPGESGRLLVRGASMFGGYLKRPELNNTTPDGWFDTGDLAFADSDGFIRISGRTKDIIIRGGENIPVLEIENLLFRHSAIADVALVGYPDERLGERACAFVVVKPGASFDLAEARRHLEANRVTRQYWPERVEIVEQLPRTATGKIQKFALRTLARRFSPTPEGGRA
jgi:cyclohexanecarboxylate-CoA ligase